jgi:hypothetical protein
MEKISKYFLLGIFFVCIVVLAVYFVMSRTGATYITKSQPSPALQVTDIPESQIFPTPMVANFPTRHPVPTTQVLKNGWRRFAYPEAGYIIDFPPDATFDLSADVFLDYSETIIHFPRSIDLGVGMMIFTDLNKGNISLDQYADEELNQNTYRKPPKAEGNIQKITNAIAEHNALTFVSKNNCPIVFIESKDRFYEIMLGPNMTTGNTPTNESVNLFWKIIDTFTIL